MDRTFWHKQSADKPLFPELEWSQPETKAQAGKLAIIGGHAQSFAAPALAYSSAEQAGIGTVRVLLPQSLKKLSGQLFETLEYAPSNPSGSFGQGALDAWLDIAQWADGVLIAGDLGHNSETEIIFEKFIHKFSGQITISGDAIEYALAVPNEILNRHDTTLILSLNQLQKLTMSAGATLPVTQAAGLLRLVDALHNLTSLNAIRVVTIYENTVCVASDGDVSTTSIPNRPTWQTERAAHAAVWLLQNPSKAFAALSTSVIV